MRRSSTFSRYAAAAVLACTAAAFGQGSMAAQPPVPVVPSAPIVPAAPAAPAAPLAAVSPAPQAGAQGAAQRVLVIPFAAYNLPDNEQWIPKAVQEDLIAGLGATRSLSPLAFQGQVIVEDNATAARLAKNASAAYAVRGAAQVVNGTVRITAQLIDANTGETVNTATVTGPVNDLLTMEDGLANQLLGLPEAAVAAPQTVGQLATAPATASAAPQIIVIAPPAQASYPAYYPSPYASLASDYIPYDYAPLGFVDYGYPGYCYGGFYPGFIVETINRGPFDHRGDHGRGDDGHHGENGSSGGFDGGGGVFRVGGLGGGGRPVTGGAGLPLPAGGTALPSGNIGLPIPQHSSLTFSPHEGGFGGQGPGPMGGFSGGGGGGFSGGAGPGGGFSGGGGFHGGGGGGGRR